MTTKVFGWCICPICFRKGQLKLRKNRYWNIDHYKNDEITLLDTNYTSSGFIGRYTKSCYIGRHLPPDISILRKIQ